ncbi:McrB family protein [Paraclostridium sordellii]|uniref:McrB family protein n=1 Tax=Paraclostridium sordellii TaxID=1505 RepID=UPI0005DBC94D|nr:AAA family ATPase [Paeniclostridium sordellii]CEQ15163.1 restriction enzyme [[Clostridium] sordellii] [Paeniclostridium sordellii]
MNIEGIIEKAKEYKFDDNLTKEAEQKRLSFINKFPLEKIKDLKIEEYALQKDNSPDKYKETMIYYLERKNILAGIGGGNSSKFYIYMNKEGKYCKGRSKNKEILEGEALEQEFTKLKKNIYDSIMLAKEDNIEEILKINTPLWNMVLLKLLCIYVPEKFISLLSAEYIIPLAQDLGLDDKFDINSDNIIRLNYEATKVLKQQDFFKNWNYEKLGKFIYTLYNKSEKKANYWMLGTTYDGKDSKAPDFIKKNKIAIGYFKYDISEYIDDNKELEKLIDKNNEPKSKDPLLQFLKIRKGDIVALKASYTQGPRENSIGMIRIDAIGRVTEDPIDGYEFDKDLVHTLPVEWITTESKIYEKITYLKAISHVRNKDVLNRVFKNIEKKLNQDTDTADYEEINDNKNIIFYGPPGTGKTYNVVNKALEIIDKEYYKDLLNSDSEDNRIKIVDEFNKLMAKGQIAFCTFHQSYGYEEFIEGLKSDGKGNFVCEDGVLKEISTRASYSGIINKSSNTLDLNSKKEVVKENIKNKEMFDFKGKDKYVLIIDEINRGNISKIFGELLTLLEEDKRITKENQVICKLTYTKENFSLPPNLYIIGTMNTADRSIALMDIALRRRFNFIEVMPDESLLEPIEDIDLSKLLEKVNKRIEYFYDRDHIIGHAYFKNIETADDLSDCLKYKIIPLLQEYFYDDFEKIGLILGGIGKSETDDYIVYKEEIEVKDLFKSYEIGELSNKNIYKIKSDIAIKDIKNIYEL